MADEEIFSGATLRERFAAAATQHSETAARQLTGLLAADGDLEAQRDDAWSLLTAASRWAAAALDSAGVSGAGTMPIRDSEAAFGLGQYLEGQLFALSQLPGFHDREAGLVDAVKRAAYAAAELGPIPGGRLAAFGRGPTVVHEVTSSPADLQEVGSDVGDALQRLEDLGLGDVVTEASHALAARTH